MRALLDVNVLLALFDRDHADHARARDWLTAEITQGWASCPLTQNGFVRVVGQPQYPSPVPVAQAIQMLARACSTEHHEFWPSDRSLLDETFVDPRRIHGPRQVTDLYLLATAVAHRGRFVTFDRAIPVSAVPGATNDHLVVL
ncbi:PIN domain-containing protein [Mumia sp. ZJ1417]|uniref:TA system VapC family ribonuclease toxin n=1 Tax=unclassified Mumia TaxID=2621872 RepID=UPI00141FC866|nr:MULTISPECIES: TA system VapC family ribonuclease toxin [unclassified Mumia]QMW64888.1 PIN domain-containing protein [Mumia sp. ZJ1417]